MQCPTKREPPCVLYCIVFSILLWLCGLVECQDLGSPATSTPQPSLSTHIQHQPNVTGHGPTHEPDNLSTQAILTSTPTSTTPHPSPTHHGHPTSQSQPEIIDNSTPKKGHSHPNRTAPLSDLYIDPSLTFNEHDGINSTTTETPGLEDGEDGWTTDSSSPQPSPVNGDFTNHDTSVNSDFTTLSPSITQTSPISVSNSFITNPSLNYNNPSTEGGLSLSQSDSASPQTPISGILPTTSSSQYISSLNLSSSSVDSMDTTPVQSSVSVKADPGALMTPTQDLGGSIVNGSADDRLGYSEATPSGEPWNDTSALPPGVDEGGLGVGGIVGITLACTLLLVAGITVGLALYHRNKSRQLDTTKAQSNHYTGLWDDSVTLSYINNHFDFFQKDVQDEMVSLDNDAYLNSLEFMVFTNTWGDGKRNTRF